jgi:integrase
MGAELTQSKQCKKKAKRQRRQRRSGSVVPIGEGKYRIGYNVSLPGEKRRQRFEVVRGDKKTADSVLQQRLVAARKGSLAESDANLTFEQLAQRFLDAKRIEKEPTTVNLYHRQLRCHVLPIIGARNLRHLTADDVRRVLREAKDTSRKKATKGRPLSATSVRSLRTLVSSVLTFGQKRDLVLKNVAKQTETPASTFREHVKFTTKDVSNLLEAARGTDLETIIVFAVGIGARRGEICGLRWGDLDLKAGTYAIARAAKNLDGKVVIGKLKTERSARSGVLPAFVRTALERHWIAQKQRHLRDLGARLGDEAFVFDRGDARGWNPNELTTAFHELVVKKELRPIRFHDLRHACASLSFASGVPLATVSRNLGHSSISITADIYTGILDETLQKASETLDGYLGDAVRRGLSRA